MAATNTTSAVPTLDPVDGVDGECGTAEADGLLPLESAERLTDVAKALADPTRVRLVAYVAAVEGGTVCACHLPERLGISQPTLSHHLKKLVDAGILDRTQQGRWAHYAVVEGALEPFAAFLAAPAAAAQEGCGPTGCA